jgi:hypothetical protein
MFVTTNRAATLTPPAGWSVHSQVSDGTDVRSWLLLRTATAADPGSTVRMRLEAYAKTSVTLLAYSGSSGVSVVTAAAEGTASVLAHTAPAASVATAGSTAVRYWADKPSLAHPWTIPAEVTTRMTTTGTGSGLLTSITGETSGLPAGPLAAAVAISTVASSKAVMWTVVLQP